MMNNSGIRSGVTIRKPRVGVPIVPVSPKTRKVQEENERIINKYGNKSRKRRIVSTQ